MVAAVFRRLWSFETNRELKFQSLRHILGARSVRRGGVTIRRSVEMPFGQVWAHTFRDRLIVNQKLYMSQSEALEAVGLSEQDAHADS